MYAVGSEYVGKERSRMWVLRLTFMSERWQKGWTEGSGSSKRHSGLPPKKSWAIGKHLCNKHIALVKWNTCLKMACQLHFSQIVKQKMNTSVF